VEVTAAWLAPLLQLIKSDSKIAAVQPKILAEHARNTFEYAGASGGFMDILGYPLCRGRVFDSAELDSRQYDDETECFWATGAAILVRSHIYHAIGGLDADFFAHMEEIDWCWRVKRAGYRVMVAPESVVFHVGGGTLTKQNPRKTYLNFRNSLVTLLKNEKMPKLIWLFPLRLLLDGVAGLKFLLNKKTADVYMIILAHWFVFRHFFSILKKRKQTQEKVEEARLAADNSQIGIVPISSVWAYFIQKKQTYSSMK
jgi:GT2 family glycosyltransferase